MQQRHLGRSTPGSTGWGARCLCGGQKEGDGVGHQGEVQVWRGPPGRPINSLNALASYTAWRHAQMREPVSCHIPPHTCRAPAGRARPALPARGRYAGAAGTGRRAAVIRSCTHPANIFEGFGGQFVHINQRRLQCALVHPAHSAKNGECTCSCRVQAERISACVE